MRIQIKTLLLAAIIALPAMASAQTYGNIPPLHVEGNQLKDPYGNKVVLHGVMDTPSPYFNNWRWGNACNDNTTGACINYFNQLFTALTDTTQGAWCNLFRLHLDPCWTNDNATAAAGFTNKDGQWYDPNGTAVGGEANIRNFNKTWFTKYLRTVYFPIARRAMNHGMYVIMRPPGVFPEKVKVGDYYNQYIIDVWDAVTKNDSIRKYSGQISIELGNEPVTVLGADGKSSPTALRDFFQPVIDKMRANGYTGIIWVPGSGWQGNYRDYATYPPTDWNMGYAVHDYVGWYNTSESSYSHSNAIKSFHDAVPVLDTNPIVITEVDWSPEKEGTGHYNEHGEYVLHNYGTWATGTTSKWGKAYKSVLDNYGNISMTLSGTSTLIDIDVYRSTKKVVKAFTDDMKAHNLDPDEASGICLDWYKEYAKVNYARPDLKKFSCADLGTGRYQNPVINADFPDPDIIRVGDVYYLCSTTMFLFPGATILKSYDLVNWEYCANPLKQIADSDPFNLANGLNHYSKGQWAPSLQYHDGKFYLNFIAFADVDGYDDGGDWVLTATDPEGEWTMKKLDGFYYDAGFCFDDNRDHLHGLGPNGEKNGDGYLYVACGIGEIRVCKLNPTTLKEIESKTVINVGNGCEGSHMYHIGDYYYIYATYGGTEGSQTIFRSKNPMGPYEEHDGRIFANQKIHQGGLVETQTGEWWTILFKDAGSIGRVPYLEPVKWTNDWPVIGNAGTDVSATAAYKTRGYPKPNVGKTYPRKALPTTDTFTDPKLGMQWEWNHNPDNTAWSLFEAPGKLRLHSASITNDLKQARNTLTQRIFGYNTASTDAAKYPDSYGTIAIDTYGMQDGDICGLTVFQDPYSYIGVKQENGKKHLVYYRQSYEEWGTVHNEVNTNGAEITQDKIFLRAICNFGTNKARFEYSLDNKTWVKFGDEMTMRFILSIFVGNRFGIFNYSTKQLGGYVDVDWFSTEPVFSEEMFYGPGVLRTYTEEEMTLDELLPIGNVEITPGGSCALDAQAKMKSGDMLNVAATSNYEIANTNVASIVGGRVVGVNEGVTTVKQTYTDAFGNSKSNTFTVTVSFFPLTANGINTNIYGTGTFSETTKALTTSQYGFGGWQYGSGIDLSAYKYLVITLRRGSSCGPSFRLFDNNNYWSEPYAMDLGTSTKKTIDLQNMVKKDGTICDPSHIYIAGFWSYGGSPIYIKEIFLSNDGNTPVGILDLEDGSVRDIEGIYTIDGVRQEAPVRGVNIINGKKVLVP